MTPELAKALTEINFIIDRPHHTAPEYQHWFANKIWEAAQRHFAAITGPMCAETIMAAGVACCAQGENGGPGWIGVV